MSKVDERWTDRRGKAVDPTGHLVYFAFGQNAGGRALDAENEFESDELAEISLWRWSTTPELVWSATDADLTISEGWYSAALDSHGDLHPDIRRFRIALERFRDNFRGFWPGMWDYLAPLDEVRCIPGYDLGSKAAGRIGAVLLSQDERSEDGRPLEPSIPSSVKQDPVAIPSYVPPPPIIGESRLVFFTQGVMAGGRALDTTRNFRQDSLEYFSLWRWKEEPEAVFSMAISDGELIEEWYPGSLLEEGSIYHHQDTRIFREWLMELQLQEEWGPTMVAMRAGCVPGYDLGQDEADRIGMVLAPAEWMHGEGSPDDEPLSPRVVPPAMPEPIDPPILRRNPVTAKEALGVVHNGPPASMEVSTEVIGKARGRFFFYKLVDSPSGPCVACGLDDRDIQFLERVDEEEPSGVKCCRDCWIRISLAAAGQHAHPEDAFDWEGTLPEDVAPFGGFGYPLD